MLRELMGRGAAGRRQSDEVTWAPSLQMVSHEVPGSHRSRFEHAGFRARDFFAHRIRFLPKCGPDGAKLAKRMSGVGAIDDLWQVVVHATSPSVDEFPRDIFFDDDLLWHQQHLHEMGQVASATMAARGSVLYTMAHQSDLVQRIGRRRDLKTRVDKVFQGWPHVLLNAIATFAVERGFATFRVPTARLMMQFTDRARTVQPELFERVYDRAVQHHYRATEVDGWWSVEVKSNRATVVVPERKVETRTVGRTVCILHDVERGFGHRDVEPAFSLQADADSDAALDRMLDVERSVGARCTYAVVGSFLPEVRARIEGRDGAGPRATEHELAFHSYDHVIATEQLNRCRQVDYRLKGYRPPQSRLTGELADESLCWNNFEWLASSRSSLERAVPWLAHRVARIPVHMDDFPLHSGQRGYDAWRRLVVEAAAGQDFIAIGLHDCYASHWLPAYRDFLLELQAMAQLRTMDEVAADLFLAAAT